MRRSEDRDRDTSKIVGRCERLESSRGVMADRRISKKTEGQGHEHFCDTDMPVRNGNFGNDRTSTTTTKSASVRKQLGTKNNVGRQAKNGGVKGRTIWECRGD